MKHWTPGLKALHDHWSSTHRAPFNRPGDKALWRAIERHYEEAERDQDRSSMAQWLDVARRFADLCQTGILSRREDQG